MSDLLVSEVLILFLLVLPILRPFFKQLKSTDAISILPLFALFISILVIVGQGISVSFLPILGIVIICIITEFTRFVMFLGGLPNNFYSFFSILLRFFLLILIITTTAYCFYFSPEAEYKLDYKNIKKENLVLKVSKKELEIAKVFTPNKLANEHIAVLILGSFYNPQDELNTMNTLTSFIANAGYKTIEMTQINEKEHWYSVKGYDSFTDVVYAITKKEMPKSVINDKLFNSVISHIVEYTKGKELYVISEGKYSQAIQDYSVQQPKAFAGIFYVVSKENFSIDKPQKEIRSLSENSFYILKEDQLSFSQEIVDYPVCLLLRDAEKLPNFGELRCNDILATKLLGSSRDLGKYDRLNLASIFEKWLKIKSAIKVSKI